MLKGINDNKYIICFSEDQRIGLWNTLKKNFIIINTISIGVVPICDTVKIVTCSNDNEMQIWNF